MINRFWLLISLLLCVSASVAQTDDPELDSLISAYDRCVADDTTKINICLSISKVHYNVDSTEMWSLRLIDLANRMHNPTMLCEGLGTLSWALFYQDRYKESIKLNYRGIMLADSLGYNEGKAFHYYMLGNNLSGAGDFVESDRNFNTAIDIYSQLGDTVRIIRSLRCMADNLLFQRAYSQAENTYLRSLSIDSAINNSRELSEDLYSLALSKFVQYVDNPDNPDIDLVLYSKRVVKDAMQLENGDLGSRYRMLFVLLNNMYYEQMFYQYTGSRRHDILDSMRNICNENVEASDRLGESLQWSTFVCLVNYHIVNNDFPTAKAYLDSLSMIESDLDLDMENQRFYYLAFRNYYNAIGDNLQSLNYSNKYYGYLLRSMSVDNAVKSANRMLQDEFDYQIRQQSERETRRAFYIILGLIIVSLVLVFVVILYFRNRQHTRLLNSVNAILSQQKEEIMVQRDEIAKNHNAITDSINYASLIQRAVMPSDDAMKHYFKDYFLIFKPLNTVAGDFYWASHIGSYKVLVCADCTGHGVPGAFLSMLGISLLDEVCNIKIRQSGNAADILNELTARLMHALGQSRELYENGVSINTDGMDLALLLIDEKNHKIQFSGAYRPLWIFRDGDIIEYRSDRRPVGLYLGPNDKPFNNIEVDYQPNDIVYLFSDGIPDQFGYIDPERKVFKHYSSRRFKDLFKQIGSKPLVEQKSIIVDTIEKWKNGFPQIDDNIVVAIRL